MTEASAGRPEETTPVTSYESSATTAMRASTDDRALRELTRRIDGLEWQLKWAKYEAERESALYRVRIETAERRIRYVTDANFRLEFVLAVFGPFVLIMTILTALAVRAL